MGLRDGKVVWAGGGDWPHSAFFCLLLGVLGVLKGEWGGFFFGRTNTKTGFGKGGGDK